MDSERSIGFDHDQADRFGEMGFEPTGVVDATASNYQSHESASVLRDGTLPAIKAATRRSPAAPSHPA